ncbi:hypothetical protein PO830_10265 [Altibacter sp. HG106]|nr:hypothetical protein [Altibacter sp. HG106]
MNSLKEFIEFNFGAFRRHYQPGLIGMFPSSEDRKAENFASKLLTQLSRVKLREHYQNIIDELLIESSIKAKKNHERRMNRIVARYFEDNQAVERIKYENRKSEQYFEISEHLRIALHEFYSGKGSIQDILTILIEKTYMFKNSIGSLLFITDIRSFAEQQLLSFFTYELIRQSKEGEIIKPLKSLFRLEDKYHDMIEILILNKLITAIEEDDTFDLIEEFFKNEGVSPGKTMAAILFLFKRNNVLKNGTTEKQMAASLSYTFNIGYTQQALSGAFSDFRNDFDQSKYRKVIYFL